MFMHGSFGHIFSNMLMLWFLGSAMENYWGSQRFLIYYMITGFGASFMQLGVNALTYMNTLNELGISNFSEVTNTVINSTYNQGLVSASESLYRMKYVPMVGASGAVFGVLLAFGMTFPNQYIYLNFFFPIKAKYFVIGYGLLELYNGIATTGSGIAHFAHLGGMIFGFFLIRKWRSNRWV
jgi:membrane associated rhomboid family serine protease